MANPESYPSRNPFSSSTSSGSPPLSGPRPHFAQHNQADSQSSFDSVDLVAQGPSFPNIRSGQAGGTGSSTSTGMDSKDSVGSGEQGGGELEAKEGPSSRTGQSTYSVFDFTSYGNSRTSELPPPIPALPSTANEASIIELPPAAVTSVAGHRSPITSPSDPVAGSPPPKFAGGAVPFDRRFSVVRSRPPSPYPSASASNSVTALNLPSSEDISTPSGYQPFSTSPPFSQNSSPDLDRGSEIVFPVTFKNESEDGHGNAHPSSPFRSPPSSGSPHTPIDMETYPLNPSSSPSSPPSSSDSRTLYPPLPNLRVNSIGRGKGVSSPLANEYPPASPSDEGGDRGISSGGPRHNRGSLTPSMSASNPNDSPPIKDDMDPSNHSHGRNDKGHPVNVFFASHPTFASNSQSPYPSLSSTRLVSTDEFGSGGHLPNPAVNPFSPGVSRKNSFSSSIHEQRAAMHVVVGEMSSKEKYDFLLGCDPSEYSGPEPDDAFYDPGKMPPRKGDSRLIVEPSGGIGGRNHFGFMGISLIGWINTLMLAFFVSGLITLFAGWPIISYVTTHSLGTNGAFNLGGINATGQVPLIPGFRGLIDQDTPASAMSRTGFDGKQYDLVFSDEFNTDNRTFWPGDDPYWTAVDLHYWQTVDLEWYDPDAITTKDGSLVITLSKEDPATNHNLNYRSGMLQSWNKFCFSGGYIEVSVSLPGTPKVEGLWPAVWTMGNLGRAGYGASLDGMWPYSYDTCDIGTLKNQTDPKTGGPPAVTTMGDPTHNNDLSFLSGQRLSSCTCSGEDHPGPQRSDGTYVGRSAPEIDIFEATVSAKGVGGISQSAQWGPFNANYLIDNKTAGAVSFPTNKYHTTPNAYVGGVFQQSSSGLSNNDQISYNNTQYNTYGFEYTASDYNNPTSGAGKITWAQGGQEMWSLSDIAMKADPVSQIGQRLVTGEPMSIIMNLAISEGFGFVDFAHLTFPARMYIDYVRVYQPTGSTNIGCDPPMFPTETYINNNKAAYTNPNLTLWSDYGKTFPKNKLIDTCSS